MSIREIDDQHKKLIGLVRQLHTAMRRGKGKDALDKILKDLIQYTGTHFAAEERLLKDNGYPEYKVRKAKHYSMSQKVAYIFRDYQDLINKIGEAADTGSSKASCFALLNAMIRYAQKHFTTEEPYLAKNAYPKYSEQKRAHEKFVQGTC